MTLFMTITGVLGVRGAALVSLWLQLRWHARREDVRRHSVLAWAVVLPQFSRIEETWPDGSRVLLTVAGVGTAELDEDLGGHRGQD